MIDISDIGDLGIILHCLHEFHGTCKIYRISLLFYQPVYTIADTVLIEQHPAGYASALYKIKDLIIRFYYRSLISCVGTGIGKKDICSVGSDISIGHCDGRIGHVSGPDIKDISYLIKL